MFIPIGSYYIFENDKLNVLDTDAVSSQVQDVVLREPITHMKSVEDIKEGHSMSNYLEVVVKMNKVRPSDNIKEVKQCLSGQTDGAAESASPFGEERE